MGEQKRRLVDRILIIDDNPTVHEAFLQVLAPFAPEEKALQELHSALLQEPIPTALQRQFEVDSAFSGEEGFQMVCRALAEAKPYIVVFVDMYMPPGWGGLQTISSIWKKCPEQNIVICTAYSEHSWEAVAKYLGNIENLVILRKPFERDEVLQLTHMLSCKSRRLAAQNRPMPGPTDEKCFLKPLIQAKQLADHGSETSFAATLNQLTTLDVIQLKCLGRASAQLAFTRTDGTQGRVWIHHGEVVHAQAPGKSGEVAFAEIVGWRAGRVEEAPQGEIHPRTITIPWQVLLLNTVRELDETLASPGQA